MLKKFKIEDYKLVSTLMVTSCKIRKDDEPKDVDQRIYISMISILLYMKFSRPDVMQTVGQVAIFQAYPKETHVLAVKRIFIYFKGSTDFGYDI